MDIERRELFRIIGAAAAGAGSSVAEPQAPRFFTPKEYDFLDGLCDVILPADEEGGGAREAGVPRYIDTLVFHADAATQNFWRSGLAAAAEVRQPGILEIVKALASSESVPSTPAERLFVRLKAVTIEAYFQSQTGMKYAGYQGNTGLLAFPGCTHEHNEE
jgi:hypothetical protein